MPLMSLRYVLLALLSKEPNTGYGLARLLQGQLSHLWESRLQQIYSELGKLRAHGLVEAETVILRNRPTKKTYTVMPAGYEALDDWLRLPPSPVRSKNDLLVKLYCLERIPKDLLVRRLEEQRDRYESDLRELSQRLAEVRRAGPAELGHVLTLEAALAQAEGLASWCAKALSRLEDAAPHSHSGAEVSVGESGKPPR